ncbi:hypothetical protein SRIMM317S_03076 [Streptomyces rimosus subsp. rimosus]
MGVTTPAASPEPASAGSAEAYPDGSIRYRNEANHLCLLAPDANHGRVNLYKCQDIPAERWNTVSP